METNARFIVDGEGLTTDRDFIIVTEQFYNEHDADVIELVIDEIDASLNYVNDHPDELIDLLVDELQINEEAVEVTVNRRVYGIEPVNEQIIEEQQEIADLFFELDIIPEKITITDVIKGD